jgi:hypothetical protein
MSLVSPLARFDGLNTEKGNESYSSLVFAQTLSMLKQLSYLLSVLAKPATATTTSGMPVDTEFKC